MTLTVVANLCALDGCLYGNRQTLTQCGSALQNTIIISCLCIFLFIYSPTDIWL